jgi:hypothetical protein
MSQQDESLFNSKMEPLKPQKAPYSAPRLIVYGKVNEITFGGGGNEGDGGGTHTMA